MERLLPLIEKMIANSRRPRHADGVLPANFMRAEISYDLVMEDDVSFVEGTFRLPSGDWLVVIVSRRDVPQVEVIPQVWKSGVTGVFIKFPCCETLNKAAVERILSEALGVSEWIEVRGPDSMQLR